MKLSRLKYYIAQRLTNLLDITVYDGIPEDDATMPYAIFKITSTNTPVRRRLDRMLEIDFWDDNTDDTNILAAADAARDGKFSGDTLLYPGFDYSVQSETDGFYKSFLQFEGEIPDTESRISRINQRYVLQVG